jgi:hypothetical protein
VCKRQNKNQFNIGSLEPKIRKRSRDLLIRGIVGLVRARIPANGLRAVIHQLFAVPGGKMSSLCIR